MDTQHSELIQLLKKRFEKHKNRHTTLDWSTVQDRLEGHPDKLKSLFEIEASDGEPDLIAVEEQSGEFIFLIAQPKALKAAAVSVTTGKRWMTEKNINPPAVQ